MYKEGHKVTTPDAKQGFVSAVYAGGVVDVDILDDNGADTTTRRYQLKEGVHIEVDQTPKLRDMTPIGRVRGTLVFAEGIIGVHVDDVSGYAGIWVSEGRMAYLAGRLELLCHHWVHIRDWDAFFDIFDLEDDESGHIYFAPIRHYAVAESCELEVMFADKSIEMWRATVDGAGNILEVTPCKEGSVDQITTLAQLRATGAIEVSLVSRYNLVGF